jgi:hypothetical protein
MEGEIMGMYVDGKKPVSETGKHFYNNTWWWLPLADYVRQIAPEIASRCKIRRSSANDEQNANAKDSKALATILQAEIDSGRTAQSAIAHQELQEAMPDVHCCKCDGTGFFKNVLGFGAGDPNNGGIKCNCCEGTGKHRPWETRFHFSAENVQNFVNFLRDSGGFEPEEWCCQCCGRPESQLKPFGKAGDPLVGDFDGAFLFRDMRADGPYFEEAEIIYSASFNGGKQYEEAERWLIEEFGEEGAGFITYIACLGAQVGGVMLCTDCIVLDYDDYHEKRLKMFGLGLSMHEIRSRAKSLLENFDQKHPALCSQIKENMAKERAAWIKELEDREEPPF